MRVKIELTVEDECKIVRKSLRRCLDMCGELCFSDEEEDYDRHLRQAIEVVLEHYSVPK